MTSKIADGLEEVWVTSESIVIHLTIQLDSGVLRGFSCRLDSDVVAEFGELRNALSKEAYPMLYVFTVVDGHEVGSRYFIHKRNNQWTIET